MNTYTHTVLNDLANDVDKLPSLTSVEVSEEVEVLAATGTDDVSKRRSKRRLFSGLPCEKMSADGENWRNSGEIKGDATDDENRENTNKMSPIDERRPVVSNTDVEKPEWRNWQTRGIQNPVLATR